MANSQLTYPHMGIGVLTNPTWTATTAQKVLDANPTRASFLIQNVGTPDVWIGFSSAVVAGAANAANRGVLLKGGQTPPAYYASDKNNGAVWVIQASGGTVDLCVEEVYPN